MRLLDALNLSGQHFLDLVGHADRVEPSPWRHPSTCEGWDVRDIADHLVGGCRMSVALIAGSTRDVALAERARPVVGDIVALTTEATERQRGALDRDDLDAITVHHPVVEMTGTQLLEQRIVEFVVHGWDLARSTGLTTEIDPALAAIAWATMSPLAEIVGALGVFGDGPTSALDDGATDAERLLDLTGRRP